MTDDELEKRAKAVTQEGVARFGQDDWQKMLSAVHRANPGGIAPEAMGQVLAQANAVELLSVAGREILIREASDGDRASDAAYSAIRQKEREAHRRLKGRS